MKEVRVWDLAVRCFHWSQVLLLGGLWWTAEEGMMEWHQVLAYSLVSLLLARLVWAFAGSETARFSHFVQSPLQALKHWDQPKKGMGHKGLSSYMVLALMALVLLQFLSGLMTTDDVFVEGPLYTQVPSGLSALAGWWHHNGFNLLLALVVVHVLAALWHLMKRDGTVGAMFSGKQLAAAEQPKEKPFWLYVVLVLLFLAAFVGWQGPLFQQTLF
ncbi:cytochrome b/b6 domain-containing protein [Rheinheimera marina]|uniref:Cytochrome b/b6 domain-containing protein n=1 Tax=Rheinheimera marina TaxID=1774958 RepID=A0ABV9JNF6_9GAMM